MRNEQQKAWKTERKTKNEMAEPAAELICPSAGRTDPEYGLDHRMGGDFLGSCLGN